MVLQTKELFGLPNRQTTCPRAFPYQDGITPGALSSYAAVRVLPNLTPLWYDEALFKWVVWEEQASEVNTLTSNAIPATSGTFTLTVNGQTTTALAFNSTAAQIQTALEALSNVVPTDVVAVATSGANLGVANAIVTLTWGNLFANTNVTVTANTASTSPNPHVFGTTIQGGAFNANAEVIDGFLWAPDDLGATTSVAGETLVQVFRMGVIHVDDIPTPGGVTLAAFHTALLAASLREKGINLQGLPGFH